MRLRMVIPDMLYDVVADDDVKLRICKRQSSVLNLGER